MGFVPKDWRDATTHEGGGDTSTPISAAALEDAETRLSDYTDSHNWTDVRSLSDDPDAVTDWGALINAAVTAGTRKFVFQHLASDGNSATEYPFTTAINLDSTMGVEFLGESFGAGQLSSISATAEPRTRLMWKGTGTGDAISASTAGGFTMRNMGVYYDSALFTGKLIDLWFHAGVLFESCQIGSRAASPLTASCVVALDNAYNVMMRDCAIEGGVWLILGMGAYGGSYSNTIRFDNCTFGEAGTGQIGDLGNDWQFNNCVFELEGSTPFSIGGTVESVTRDFVIRGGWVGDASAAGQKFANQPTNTVWNASFHDLWIQIPHGPIFDFNGGGNIIIDNSWLHTTTSGALVDLGTYANGINFRFTGNRGYATGALPILNKLGGAHVLQIERNEYRTGYPELRTQTGMTLVGYAGESYEPSPTITAGTALGGGGAANIDGVDWAGIVRLYPGAGAGTGLAATVSMGSTYTKGTTGSSYNFPLVHLSPYSLGGFGDASVIRLSIGCTDNDQDTWRIYANDTIGTAIAVGYRVVGM